METWRGASPGFGAVFTDVDLADTTKIEFFDIVGSLLYEDFVPVGTVSDQSLSFLGVVFDAGERISRVRITTGTDFLSGSNNDNPANGIDLVAMDDFLYSEPLQAPEPATGTLFGSGALTLIMATAVQRRRVRRLRENRGPEIGDSTQFSQLSWSKVVGTGEWRQQERPEGGQVNPVRLYNSREGRGSAGVDFLEPR